MSSVSTFNPKRSLSSRGGVVTRSRTRLNDSTPIHREFSSSCDSTLRESHNKDVDTESIEQQNTLNYTLNSEKSVLSRGAGKITRSRTRFINSTRNQQKSSSYNSTVSESQCNDVHTESIEQEDILYYNTNTVLRNIENNHVNA